MRRGANASASQDGTSPCAVPRRCHCSRRSWQSPAGLCESKGPSASSIDAMAEVRLHCTGRESGAGRQCGYTCLQDLSSSRKASCSLFTRYGSVCGRSKVVLTSLVPCAALGGPGLPPGPTGSCGRSVSGSAKWDSASDGGSSLVDVPVMCQQEV